MILVRSAVRSRSKLDAGKVTGSIARRPLSTAGDAPSIVIWRTMNSSRVWIFSTIAVMPPDSPARRVSSARYSPTTIASPKAGSPTRRTRRYIGVSQIRFSR